MENEISPSLADCFGEISDPRVEGRCEHLLIEVIIMAICAILTGAESWVEVETFGTLKESWLKKFLKLPGGIPSHDTFGRIFAALDAEAFQKSFARWVEGVFRVTAGQVVAIDGKTVRHSYDKTLGKAAIHMVSAWASETGLVLGQCKVDDKSNEITAIPELLRLLDVSGCIVTIDALGCQKSIAQTIRDEKADYVLQVKENQGHLYQDIQDWFAYTDQHPSAAIDRTYHETVNKAHGRIEIRRCWAIADPLAFEAIRHHDGWADLHSIVRVYRERHFNNKVERETSFYITSLPNQAERLLGAIRSHWSIENSLHWVLDVTFNEDDARLRVGNSPQNMTVLRHFALNILKNDQSKGSIRQKRYKAALDDLFLFNLLSQF
jgi:predicted transposase YbfD/YdcC